MFQEIESEMVPASEEAEDRLEIMEVSRMTDRLCREAKHVRTLIEEIEGHAVDVESPSLREAAAQRIADLRGKLFHIIAQATHGRYTADDIRGWTEHSISKGGSFPALNTRVVRDLTFIKRVPNGPIREALLDHLEGGEDRSYTEVVRTARERLIELEIEAGKDFGSDAWATDNPVQTARAMESMQTQLGMNVRQSKGGGAFCAMFIPYERAVALSRAIGMNPQEAGV